MALMTVALLNFMRLRADWRGKGSGGSQVGQIFRVERDRRKQWRVNLGSGNTGGNIGLPSLTRISGRRPCWPAVPPLVGPTSVHILEGMRALHWRTAQQHQSSPFSHICSARCCSNDSSCHSRSRKQSRASCTRSGRVKKRATAIERMTARVFREAGACVRQNVCPPRTQGTSNEVLAQDLPCFAGAQLAVDITLRSALSCNGEAHLHAADHDGAVLVQARQDKETTYPELASSGRCKLVVLAIETGRRWSEEAVHTMQQLAHARAREAPSFMQFPVALMWERRWTRMLAVCCAVSFAASLVEPARNTTWCRTDGERPLLADFFDCDPR